MSYCHNCGMRVQETDAFCPECGTKLHQCKQESVQLHGYVFTNLRILSAKSGMSVEMVRSVLDKFILWRGYQGINYLLLDVSDYHSPFTGDKIYSLTAEDGWSAHQQLLTDRYCYDVDHCGHDVSYLFIIGGHDVIPMPKVGEHCCEREDQIDSDLPYGMLYGRKTEDMLQDRTLFQVPQMLHVGRLPLSPKREDVYMELETFIDRTITMAQNGLSGISMYGQVDPHWKQVSFAVAGDFVKSGQVVSHSSVDENDTFDFLVLTPDVVLDRVPGFFDNKATFYYFNMHGSNAPQSPYFYGQAMDSRCMSPGISPEELSSTQKSNVVVTEACYGARFIGYGRDGSMLLSSLGNGRTVLYLGASRIALGALDTGFRGEESLSHADLMAKIFMSSLLSGYSAGQALFLARRKVLESDGLCSHASPTTVTEFNLFGDPSLHLYGVNSTIRIAHKSMKESMYCCSIPVRIDAHKVFSSSTIGGSLLDQIRLHVDSNFRQIRHTIETHLYSMYNIRPKSLNSVYRCKSSSDESYSYNFIGENDENLIVELDRDSNIKKVLTEKYQK